MFVAVARIPASPAALQQAAALAGLARADLSRALAGVLPRILLRAAPDGERLVRDLEALGFAAFAAEASDVSTDAQRIVARNLELAPGGLTALDGTGLRHACPAEAIETLVQGVRWVESTETVQTTERKLALGRALITSGLSVTKKVVTTTERTTSDKESFVLIARRDGGPDIMLYERRLNYACLGPDLQASTHGNFVALLARLRDPGTPLDDRITRPGFLAGLPLMSVDPVDLAIFLTTQARRLGA